MPKRNGDGKVIDGSTRFKRQIHAQNTGNIESKPGQVPCLNTAEISHQKELRSALRHHERAVRVHPEEAANWFDLGRLLLDIGQNQRAEAALQEALRRAPDSATYRYYLGKALMSNGNFSEAANHFKHLADIDPELEDPMSAIGFSVCTNLGYCLGEMGDWEGALATLQPAVGTAISIFCDLARFLSCAGQFERAYFLCTVALLLAPGDPELLHGAGYTQMKLGRLEKAQIFLQKARTGKPGDPHVWYDLGVTLARMRKREKARTCFRKVLQLDPKYFWAWYDLACLDALEKKPAAAFRNLYKSIECGFRDADYLLRDSDFKGIRKDPRWSVVIDLISDLTKSEETAGVPLQ